jgi:hypothetical protein
MDINAIITRSKWANDNKTAEVEINLQLSMQEKLARTIDREMNSKKSSKSWTTKDVTSIVKKECYAISFYSNSKKYYTYNPEILKLGHLNILKTKLNLKLSNICWIKREKIMEEKRKKENRSNCLQSRKHRPFKDRHWARLLNN